LYTDTTETTNVPNAIELAHSLAVQLPQVGFIGNNLGGAVSDSQYPAGLRNNNPSFKLGVQFMHQNLTIWNCDPVGSEIKILWLRAKKDMDANSEPSVFWGSILTSRGSERATYVSATSPNVYGTTGTMTKEMPGCSPLELVEFKKLWELAHYEKFNLSAGDSKKFSITYKVNKVFEYNQIRNAKAQGLKYIGGVSIVPLIIYQGHPVLNGAASQVNQRPTYGKTTIGWIAQNKFRFGAVKGTMFQRTQLGTFSIPQGSITGTSKATETFLNVVDAIITGDAIVP